MKEVKTYESGNSNNQNYVVNNSTSHTDVETKKIEDAATVDRVSHYDSLSYENRDKVIEIEDLNLHFDTYAGEVKAIRGVSFDIYDGEVLALVGESGCGKTVVSKSILQILPNNAVIQEGSKITYMGKDVLNMSKNELKDYKGSEVSMIFQDPMTSLNPTTKIGKQITESLLLHTKMSKDEAKKEAIRLLETVNIPNAAKRYNQYPFELSGGMRQRVMIAIALACNPNVILADEPTTALDVTIQAQIIDLLRDLKQKQNTSIVLVTHDLGVVADFADRIQIMYAGEIMETGTVREIFFEGKHPYTWALLRSVPKMNSTKDEVLYSLKGTPPDLIQDIKGCPFVDRCEYAMEICRAQKPPFYEFSEFHKCKCWLNHEYAPKVEKPI